MKPFFEPEDFESIKNIMGDSFPYYASRIANIKLQKLIEAAPVMYLKKMDGVGYCGSEINGPGRYDDFTARLICIEPIVKEECKHLPDFYNIHGVEPMSFKCTKCGVELKAKWEPVK